jgi:hypothetical protein
VVSVNSVSRRWAASTEASFLRGLSETGLKIGVEMFDFVDRPIEQSS